MREVADFLKANDAYFLLGLSLLSLILLVCTLSFGRKIARLSRRRNAKLTGDRVGDIVDCLTDQQVALERLENELRETQDKQTQQAVTLTGCLKNVGVVRFNAFDDVGGEQSFAVVVLDSNRNGVAVSSLYGRQDSRVYAKAIVSGQGERPLSDEEQRALDIALK